MQLTQHFSLEEFTRSSTATAQGISNIPNEEQIANLKALCENVLEPLRQWYGKPITISSGYRCPALNAAVGGKPNSQHLKGEAADLHIPSMEVCNAWIRYLLEFGHFDQMIKERDQYGNSWLHISFKRTGTNRQTYIPNLLKK